MIEKYYNGVIEQVAGGIGNVEHNSILVRYSNDFSIWDLESVNHYKDQTDIFFTCHEFSYNKIAEAYEPYLGLIRQMFHKYCSGTLEEFMEECDVYKLQRPVFESYFEKGFCERTEQILIDEVEYEQERMRNSIVTMLQKILAPNTGILNQAIAALGGDGSTFFLMDAKYFYRILFSMDLWKNIGWDSIMYLAAISSVDPTLYEAAEMDGCGKLKKMWHITLPGIRGTIGILFIMGIGGLLSSGVDQVWLLRTPGNMSIADTLDIYVLRVGLQGGQFGYATAIGLIQGLVGLVLVVACNKICKKMTEVSLW